MHIEPATPDNLSAIRAAYAHGRNGVFSVAHADPAIWRSLERGAHIYLHRIARTVGWSGRGLMDAILAWASDQCSALRREGIRIDTWASNASLIAERELDIQSPPS